MLFYHLSFDCTHLIAPWSLHTFVSLFLCSLLQRCQLHGLGLPICRNGPRIIRNLCSDLGLSMNSLFINLAHWVMAQFHLILHLLAHYNPKSAPSFSFLLYNFILIFGQFVQLACIVIKANRSAWLGYVQQVEQNLDIPITGSQLTRWVPFKTMDFFFFLF